MERRVLGPSLERKSQIREHLAKSQPQKRRWLYDGVGPRTQHSPSLMKELEGGLASEVADKRFHYDVTFKNALAVLGVSSLQDLLANRKEAGKTNRMLDLFGGGYFSDIDMIDSITAVRLADTDDYTLLAEYEEDYAKALAYGKIPVSLYFQRRIDDLKKVLAFQNRKVIYQNVFTTQAWVELEDHIFDITTIRPEGGLHLDEYMLFSEQLNLYYDDQNMLEEGKRKYNYKVFQPYANIFYTTFLRAKQLMSSDGIMLGQIPNLMPEEFVRRFEHIANSGGEGKITVFPAPTRIDNIYKLGTFVYQKAA